jgi:hypothetical protein
MLLNNQKQTKLKKKEGDIRFIKLHAGKKNIGVKLYNKNNRHYYFVLVPLVAALYNSTTRSLYKTYN